MPTLVLAGDGLIDWQFYGSASDDAQEDGAPEESRDQESGRELGEEKVGHVMDRWGPRACFHDVLTLRFRGRWLLRTGDSVRGDSSASKGLRKGRRAGPRMNAKQQKSPSAKASKAVTRNRMREKQQRGLYMEQGRLCCSTKHQEISGTLARATVVGWDVTLDCPHCLTEHEGAAIFWIMLRDHDRGKRKCCISCTDS